MTRFLILSCTLIFSLQLRSQAPQNDDCQGIVDLGTAPACPSAVFTNVGATNSNIGFDNNPSCFNGGIASRDVWFKFDCPDTLFDFRIEVIGLPPTGMKNPQIAVYRGDCSFDGLAELDCRAAAPGENKIFLDLTDLTPNATYFVRVSDFSLTGSPNWGEFSICVDKIPPILTIDQGSTSLCAGVLTDTGGADGDYGPNEIFDFTICPTQPSACLIFTLEYFALDYNEAPINENGNDILAFFDGPTLDPDKLIAQINGPGNLPQIVAGGGGVAFPIQAVSGCLTVHFESDNQTESLGFKGSWQCSDKPCPQASSLSVTPGVPADTIVAAVSTPFTDVKVTKINCPQHAYGTFSFPTDDNSLGLEKGLLLTSGRADLAIGPNNKASAGVANYVLGDPDLNYLSSIFGSGTPSKDACVVELDVFAATDELTFEYVFGSEEYPEFANDEYNDIFAFLVSGPGIAGDPNLTNSAKNIAIIPSTTQPVQINSVNNIHNWQFYRNNELSAELQYDGLTTDIFGTKKTLTARTPVIPCNTYHLKLAIADRSDHIYDSGVFISEIKGGTPKVSFSSANGIDYLAEGCSGDFEQIVFSLANPLPDTFFFEIKISGTAENGMDYVLNLPQKIAIPAGQTSVSFPISVLTDALPESIETIVLAMVNDFGCGEFEYTRLTLELHDRIEISLAGGQDSLVFCKNATFQLHAEGATSYFWQPPGAVSNPFIADPILTATQSGWLKATGSVGACSGVDSIFVKVVEPQIQITTADPTGICLGGQVKLQVIDNVGHASLTWTPSAGLSDPASPNPTAQPTQTTAYVASVSQGGCTVADTILIMVDTLFMPTIFSFPNPICQNTAVKLASSLVNSNRYEWSPPTGLSNPNLSGPTAMPDVSTTYTLTVTSANAFCSATASVSLVVQPADVDIQGDFLKKICLGDTLDLGVMTNPPGTTNIVWSPSFGLSATTGASVRAFPDETTTFFANFKINGCEARDSVRVRVDSLPVDEIFKKPNKPFYCQGDTVLLLSPTYEPANFPDFDVRWLPFGNQLTPDSSWNLLIVATETHVFQRVMRSGVCVDTSEVLLQVSKPPEVTITVSDPAVCPGETVSLLVTTVPPDTKIEWDANPPVPCTDCKNPSVTVFNTSVFSLKTPDALCPTTASASVDAFDLPKFNLAQNPTICPGDSVLLNNVTDPGTVFSWTTVPPSGFASTETNPLVKPTQSTTYHVEAITSNGCEAAADVSVSLASATISAGSDQSICRGETAVLTATTSGTPGILTWPSVGKTGTSIAEAPFITTDFPVVLTFNGNCTATDTVRVFVKIPPTFDSLQVVPADSSVLCLGVPIQLKAFFSPPENLTFKWTETIDGQAITLPETTSTLQPKPDSESGSVAYQVVATNAEGCSATAPERIFQIKKCYSMPNAFTPGNGGENETFGLVLLGGEVEVLDFQIFTRWGERIFSAAPGRERWDGMVGSQPAASDVYVYFMKIRLPDGQEIPLSGEVTLLR